MRVILKDVWEKYRIKFIRGTQVTWADHWALRGVDFTLNDGEVAGIIGKNGAGKSTLLKLIAGIFPPDKGSRCVQGTVASLFDLGAGLLPELTGRENILHNMKSYGIDNRNVEEKVREIINFSQIGDFIDAPVKYYSSGMYARVAFSLALSVHPDIFLVDDILSVGDTFFQKQCIDKLGELKKRGCSVAVVSHDMGILRALCDRIVVIDEGRTVFNGDVERAIDFYLHKQIAPEMKRDIITEGEGEYPFSFPSLKGVALSLRAVMKSVTSDSDLYGAFLQGERGRIVYFPGASLRLSLREKSNEEAIQFSFVSEQDCHSPCRILYTCVLDIAELQVKEVFAGIDRILLEHIDDLPIRLHEHILDEVALRSSTGYLIFRAPGGFFSVAVKEKKIQVTMGILRPFLREKEEVNTMGIAYQQTYIPESKALQTVTVGTRLALAREGSTMNLYCRDKKLTSGQGMYISLKRGGAWFDSRQSQISHMNKRENCLVIERQWYFFNIKQTEKYTVSDTEVTIGISISVPSPITRCALAHWGCMLDVRYNQYTFEPVCRGRCEDTFASSYQDAPALYFNLPARTPLVLSGERVPAMTIEDLTKAHNFILENSDTFYTSRILKIEKQRADEIFAGIDFNIRITFS